MNGNVNGSLNGAANGPADGAKRDEPLKVLETPFCGDLRSKKFFLRDSILNSAEEYMDGSGHVWCYHTQMPIGPDGMRVAPEYCTPDRPCYRSALAEPVAEAVIRKEKKEPTTEEV